MKKFHLNIWNLSVLLLLSLAIVSCSVSRQSTLQKSVEGFWDGMRWNSAKSVSGYIGGNERGNLIVGLDRALKKVRVVDYSIVDLKMDEASEKAVAVVQFSFYRLDTNNLMSVQRVQKWEHEGTSGWKTVTPPFAENKKQLPPSPKRKQFGSQEK